MPNEELDLLQQANAVHEWQSFLQFATALRVDREQDVLKDAQSPSASPFGEPGGWQNGTIESFLDAAIRWAEATRFGQTQGMSGVNPWSLFAVFLYCGKIYE